jgi:hypothetical protein
MPMSNAIILSAGAKQADAEAVRDRADFKKPLDGLVRPNGATGALTAAC